MRKISEIIIHCTADNEGVDHDLMYYNNIHKKRGFSECGYHYIIHPDGKIEGARPVSKIGAHCIGHNRNSIGIAYIGGLRDGKPANTITAFQIDALRKFLFANLYAYNLPYSAIKLHCEYSNKKCPCFTRKWFDSVFKSYLENPLAFELLK